MKFAEKYSEKWIEGVSITILGNLASKTAKYNSQVKEAESLIRHGIDILNRRKILPWATVGYYLLGQSHATTGNIKKALPNLSKADNLFEKLEMDYWLKKTRNVLGFL